MSVDKYFGLRYDSKNYHCAHFACDVWRDLTGVDLSSHLLGRLSDVPSASVNTKFFRRLKQSSTPVDPSIAIFQYCRGVPHVGVYLRGRLLHISKTQGVRFDRLSDVAAQAKKVRFYTC